GVKPQKLFGRHVRHGERIVREVDSLLLFVPFIHWEIDDPAELEAILGDDSKLLADLAARGAGELGSGRRLVGDEEHAIAWPDAGLVSHPFLNICGHEFGDWAFAVLSFPHDISKPGSAHLGARPLVELVKPRARLSRRAGCRNPAHDTSRFDHVPESIER